MTSVSQGFLKVCNTFITVQYIPSLPVSCGTYFPANMSFHSISGTQLDFKSCSLVKHLQVAKYLQKTHYDNMPMQSVILFGHF